MSGGGHHHAHGPANRGRFVLATTAPLFICEPPETPGSTSQAVVAVHGPYGVTAEFERAVRAIAVRGLLVAAPILYFRDGGGEYLTPESAAAAYATLTDTGVDADIDGAIAHVVDRLGLRVAAVVGAGAFLSALLRAGERHPSVPVMHLPDSAESGRNPAQARIVLGDHLGWAGSATASWLA
jgi:hypothetical protein